MKEDWPNIQMYFASVGSYSQMVVDFDRVFGLDGDLLDPVFGQYTGNDSFIFFPVLGNEMLCTLVFLTVVKSMYSSFADE